MTPFSPDQGPKFLENHLRPGPAGPHPPAIGGPPRGKDDKGSPAGMDTVALLGAVRRRWLLAAAAGTCAMVLGAGLAWHQVPSKWEARTLLRVNAIPPSILPNELDRTNFVNYQRAQLTMIKSRLVLNAALRDPGVADLDVVRDQLNPVEWLEKGIRADYSLAPEILRISMSGGNPEILTAVVNAVRDAYLAEIVNKERNDRRTYLEHLEKLYGKYDAILSRHRSTLRELAQEAGSGNAQTLAHRQQFALERLALAHRELFQLQSDLRKAQIEVAGQKAADLPPEKISVPDKVVEEALERDPAVLRLQGDVDQLEVLVEDTRRVAARGEREPAVMKARAQLDEARKAVAARKEALRTRVVSELRAKALNDLRANAAQQLARVELLKNLEKAVGEEVKRLEQEARTINKGSIDLESIKDDLKHTEEVAKKVATQMEALKVELDAPPRVSHLEEAVVTSPDDKKKMMGVAGGGLGAMALAIFAVAWWELRARRVSTVDEVKSRLGVRLLGALPSVSRRDRQRGPGRQVSVPTRMLMESVDAVRTQLLHYVREQSLRTVMVTSAVSGEGKTTFACYLAASLARAGYRTLLIDGDLRSPMLHRLFGLAPAPGLSEALRAEVAAPGAVQDGPMDKLWVLPAGRCDGPALQALAQDRFREVLGALKEGYDFVVIDSAPVLPVVDSLLIGQHADAVVFSVLRDVSCLPQMTSALERLDTLGIRVLGTVIGGVRTSDYGSSYRYTSAPA